MCDIIFPYIDLLKTGSGHNISYKQFPLVFWC